MRLDMFHKPLKRMNIFMAYAADKLILLAGFPVFFGFGGFFLI
jgi:hypothetical protein